MLSAIFLNWSELSVIIEASKLDAAGVPRELIFDAEWYAKKNGLDAGWSVAQIRTHYEKVGIAQNLQPSPYFSPAYVQFQLARQGLDTSGDLIKSFMKHYKTVSPHILLPITSTSFKQHDPLFEGVEDEWYNKSVYALRAMDGQKYRHNIFFDPSFILDESGLPAKSPLEYYLRNLSNTRTQTSVLFDPDFYAAVYPDVARSGGATIGMLDLLEHFLRFGMYENKMPFPDLDVGYYMSKYPDLADSGISPVEHFLYHGIREHRDPNPYFDTRYYTEHQPDVAASIIKHRLHGPFEHFLKFGYKAGYKARQPLHSVVVPDETGKALYEKRCNVTTTALVRSGGVIKFPEVKGPPKVSCIIPVVNQGHMTIHLLKMLSDISWRRDMPSMEVVVVDNGSTDLTLQLNELTEGVKVLRSDDPLGYPRACNWGAREATGEVLLFMNNDIEVGGDALRRGVERLAEMPDIGAVGGRILLMNGNLQEAGSLLHDDGSAMGLGRATEPDLPVNNAPRRVDYCSGCFLFVRQSDFNAVDGFDEVFNPGYYEEADLCLRLQKRGLDTLMDPSIYIYHYEYASYSKGRPATTSMALMRRNQRTFRSRHIQVLSGRAPHSSAEGQRNNRLAFEGKSLSIAVVEDVIPDRRMGSGFVRTADLIDTMLSEGHRVTLFVPHYMAGANEDIWRLKGVEIVKLFEAGAPAQPLSGREWDFDTLWVCRTHNIRTWSDHLRGARRINPNIKLIIDTEAIVSLRERTHAVLQGRKLQQSQAEMLLAELETDSAVLPDTIVTVNDLDRAAVQELQVATVLKLGHKMATRTDIVGLKNRKNLFFCGSIHELKSPNYDSLDWFIKQVWPHVRKAMPDAQFNIVGHCSGGVSLDELITGAPGVFYLGRVDDLREYMDAARVFVAPTRYAGGIPHKVHEAMAHGLPVVCSDLLRSQLREADQDLDAVPTLSAGSQDPEGFAAACCLALSDDEMWQYLQSNALSFVEQTASTAVFEANLREILDAV